ncbi:hypothetical protein Aduo_018360 [Ancylostoma duodenale]
MRLRENSVLFPKGVSVNDAHKFFRQFVKDVVLQAYDEPFRRFVTARSRAQKNHFIVIPYQMIIGFVLETMKCGRTPLCDENDEVERRNIKRDLLHCIQMALETENRQPGRRMR